MSLTLTLTLPTAARTDPVLLRVRKTQRRTLGCSRVPANWWLCVAATTGQGVAALRVDEAGFHAGACGGPAWRTRRCTVLLAAAWARRERETPQHVIADAITSAGSAEELNTPGLLRKPSKRTL